MKSGRLFIILVLLIIFAAACQSDSTSQDMADNPTTASADEAEQSSEVQNAQDVYPAPQVEPTAPLPAVLYPMLTDGDEVSWHQAQALIKNDEVERISQTHDLKVTLFLKDGRALMTIEPAIDEVLRIIEMCGQACSEIVVATE
jgi:uncharacterized lipoprotein